MSGEDLDVVRQREEFAEEAVIELLGLPRLGAGTEEVWSPDAAGEERVPGEDEPGLLSPGAIGHQDRDAVRRVARGVENGETHIAQLVLLAVFHVDVREADVG